MSIVDENAISDASGNETIHDVVASRLSRRALIGGGVAGAAVLSGVGALVGAIPAHAGGAGRVARPATELGFHGDPAVVGGHGGGPTGLHGTGVDRLG